MTIHEDWRGTNEWEFVRDAIQDRSLTIREEEFILSSGRQSKIHFTMSRTILYSKAASLISMMILDEMQSLQLKSIGGLAMGAIPLVSSIVATSRSHGYDIDGFFIRKEPKSHGALQTYDGVMPVGIDYALADDVATSGGSIDTARLMMTKDEFASPRHAFVVIDREEGATEYLAERGMKLHALFKKSDFTTLV